VSLEAERIRELTGMDARYRRFAAGLSGSAGVGAQLPLHGPWVLWARLDARATLMRESLDGLRLQPGALLLLGAGRER
jgi:hypothetical protein